MHPTSKESAHRPRMRKLNLRNLKIAVIGLGYVGLPLAVEFGRHFDTVGFDIRASRWRN